ncbi:MAG TPA: hypothetical protein VFQ27_08200 [Xanthobacteraceae bacterium]|nr:hypothetical protein [Xanthobacteraceae bacterium]
MFGLSLVRGYPFAALIVAMLCAGGTHARAAEVIFPTALRVGMVPPPGFVPGQNIPGFRHNEKAASILIAELPGEVFDSIEKQVTAELQRDAQTPVTRTDVTVKDGGSGFILYGRPTGPQGPVQRWTMVAHAKNVTAVVTAIIPEQVKDVASDADIRAAFATLTVRDAVPVAEQLSVLPFAMNDLAGFRIVRVEPGSAALLTDGPSDVIRLSDQPLLLVSIAPALAQIQPQPHERDALARRLFGEMTGLKDIRLTRSEPLRVAGQQGHELLAEAKDTKTETELTAVQWLRFGTGTLLRIVGIARKEDWPGLYQRFRQVRDGIGPK